MIPEGQMEKHKQIYAQLKKEVLSGKYDYLDKEEEKKVQGPNKAYYRQSPWEDVSHACFHHPDA